MAKPYIYIYIYIHILPSGHDFQYSAAIVYVCVLQCVSVSMWCGVVWCVCARVHIIT